MASLAAAGWWVLRAPAIERVAVAPPPDIDIDPPAMRARREAALALATMPDDPWTFAESLAASAPARVVEKEDCGIEGRARFSEPNVSGEAPVQLGGASTSYATAQARIDAALRSSSDPLDRAVADLINLGDMRTEAGRDEAVAQQAVATTDARVYALGYGLCNGLRVPAASCSAISLDRWIEIDPGNGIPWMTMLGQAQARGDVPGIRSAMSHLASATRFDVYAQVAAGAVAERAPKDDQNLAAVNDLATQVVTQTEGRTLPRFQPLIQVCKGQAGGDAELAQACRSISDVMFEHSDNLLSQSMSGALLFQTTGDASRREYIRTERAVAAARWSPATGFSECHDMRDSLKKVLRMAQVGEVEALREQARKFVTP